jgi:hypothetical protein
MLTIVDSIVASIRLIDRFVVRIHDIALHYCCQVYVSFELPLSRTPLGYKMSTVLALTTICGRRGSDII